MKKRVPLVIAAVLTACGAVATTSNDSAESAPQKKQTPPRGSVGIRGFGDSGGMAGCFDPKLSGYPRRAAEQLGGVPCDESQGKAGAAGDDPWLGEYKGPAVEGMKGNVSIARGAAANRYRVGIDVTGRGCSGAVEGVGTASGNRMSLSVRVPDEAEQCRIILDRNGSRLRVTEEGGCQYFHGAQCRFDMNVSRARATSAAPARQVPWIVGAWVERSFACGGEGMIVNADGSYTTDADAGSWTLSGETLTLIQRETFEMGEDPTTLAQPRHLRFRVVPSGPQAFTMREADGTLWHMKRCR